MKVSFAHDHIFYFDNHQNVYSSGKLPYSVWKRYLRYFDELIIIGRATPYDPQKRLVLSSGPNVHFQAIPNLSGFLAKFKNIKSSRNLITKTLKKSDALIVRLPSEIGLLSIQIAEQIKLPWAVEVVGCPLHAYWYHGHFLGKIYAPIVYIKTKRAIAKARFAIYVTEKYLQNKYPSYGYTASAANVEIDEPNQAILEQKLHFLAFNKTIYKIGLIGGISTKIKGIDTSIKAMKCLKNSKENFILEIVGDGNPQLWEEKIRKHGLEKRIIFKGTLKKGSELNSWLDSIDVYIQPSLTEGLPRALIEAMSRACPAVGSKVGGIPELLDNDFVHSPGDYNRLANLILHLIENKELAKQQAIQNFKVAKKFSKNILDEKRNYFWHTFYEYVNTKKSNLIERIDHP